MILTDDLYISGYIDVYVNVMKCSQISNLVILLTCQFDVSLLLLHTFFYSAITLQLMILTDDSYISQDIDVYAHGCYEIFQICIRSFF